MVSEGIPSTEDSETVAADGASTNAGTSTQDQGTASPVTPALKKQRQQPESLPARSDDEQARLIKVRTVYFMPWNYGLANPTVIRLLLQDSVTGLVELPESTTQKKRGKRRPNVPEWRQKWQHIVIQLRARTISLLEQRAEERQPRSCSRLPNYVLVAPTRPYLPWSVNTAAVLSMATMHVPIRMIRTRAKLLDL